MKSEGSKAEQLVRELALAYPEAYEETPWGHAAIKVRGKAFLFMGTNEGRFGISVKLPHSNEAALTLPFTEPTGYGLGKSGWVSASFDAADLPPMPILRAWVDESYRTIAPKKLVALLDGAPAPKAAATRTASKAKAPAKAASKKAPAAAAKKAPRKAKTPASRAARTSKTVRG